MVCHLSLGERLQNLYTKVRTKLNLTIRTFGEQTDSALSLLKLLERLTVNNVCCLQALRFTHLWHKKLLRNVFHYFFQYAILVAFILIILDTPRSKTSTNHESEQTPGNRLYLIHMAFVFCMIFSSLFQKLKTNTSTRKSTLTLVTLPSFSISGEISAEKMYVENWKIYRRLYDWGYAFWRRVYYTISLLWTTRKLHEVTNIRFLHSNIHCSYSSVCLPMFAPNYLSLSFPWSYFVLHVKGRGITRKPQGSFIPLARL